MTFGDLEEESQPAPVVAAEKSAAPVQPSRNAGPAA